MPKARKTSNSSMPAKKTPTRRKTASATAPAAPAPATTATNASAPRATPAPGRSLTREERHRMIAEAAYYIALRRGFNSDPRANWLEAEAEIEARLKG